MAFAQLWPPLSCSMLNITLCPLVHVRPLSQGFPRHWDILGSGSTHTAASLLGGTGLVRLQPKMGWLKQAQWALQSFRRLFTGMCAPGWTLTQCSGDNPAGSPHRAVSGHAGSVLSVVTGPGLAFTQMIWKLQCCWVQASCSFHLKLIILLQYSFFRV